MRKTRKIIMAAWHETYNERDNQWILFSADYGV